MPADLTVRTATLEDEARVTALLKSSYTLLMRPNYDEAVLSVALPIMTQANPRLLSSGTYYVAEIPDGHIVGCGGWTRERPDNGRIERGLAHLRHFATHPDWINRGVGHAIYAQCEEKARQAGVRKLECYSSLNAEEFYAALGFKAVRRIVIPMRPGLNVPSILMERSI